ncbi:MAG: hypothetical protein U9Q73_02575 [Nanoarchaeota archaeon]|nr:hypothetical protein [Nanoarchaeota archaeon]
MNSKLNKKGVIGRFITMFIATIVIVLIVSILLIFVLGAGVVEKFDNVDAGVKIYDEDETGLNDVFDYVSDYEKFVEARYLVEGGMDLDSALAEVGYGG